MVRHNNASLVFPQILSPAQLPFQSNHLRNGSQNGAGGSKQQKLFKSRFYCATNRNCLRNCALTISLRHSSVESQSMEAIGVRQPSYHHSKKNASNNIWRHANDRQQESLKASKSQSSQKSLSP